MESLFTAYDFTFTSSSSGIDNDEDDKNIFIRFSTASPDYFFIGKEAENTDEDDSIITSDSDVRIKPLFRINDGVYLI
jgi:hypothetical protein